MISAYQLYESCVMGADAVLLIVRILEPKQLKDYLDICDELKLDALVEIHTEKDLETATGSGARLIGINTRNLRSFETDIKTAISLKSLFEPYQIAVAASGIHARTDIEKNLNAGIWNFLIGESLVKAQNPRDFLRSLIHPGKPF
jgi:indole-3-glycerol phosphate synthase